MTGLIKYYGRILFMAFCIVAYFSLIAATFFVIPVVSIANLGFVYGGFISFVCWVLGVALMIAVFG